jgi:hypothetical protein
MVLICRFPTRKKSKLRWISYLLERCQPCQDRDYSRRNEIPDMSAHLQAGCQPSLVSKDGCHDKEWHETNRCKPKLRRDWTGRKEGHKGGGQSMKG